MTAKTPSSKLRVFLVDDHPLVREWLTNLINQQTDLMVCGEAATAAQAMQGVPALQPNIAIVDISLKDSSGVELIKQLLAICPELKVLVFSMHDEALYAQRTLRAGGKGYIMKREATGKVIEAIRCVLQGRLYISDAIAQTIATQFVEGTSHSTHSPVEQLTDRELAVFDLLGQGLGTRRIAEILRVSIKTVQTHCARVKEKLGLNSASELVREAVRYREAQIRDPG